MKDKLEQIFNKYHEGYAVYNKDEIIKELLVLFSVVGQRKQLFCPHCKEQSYLVHEKEYECLISECRHKWAK